MAKQSSISDLKSIGIEWMFFHRRHAYPMAYVTRVMGQGDVWLPSGKKWIQPVAFCCVPWLI